MKIAQFYDKQHIRLGIIRDENLLPLDFEGDMIDFIKERPKYKVTGKAVPVSSVKLFSPVHNPTKIVAIGRNYLAHIQEGKRDIPKSPLVFSKFPSSIIGHNDQIRWDSSLTDKVDFEAELAVIIGKKIYNCPQTKVTSAIFGYTCANDVSARDLQHDDKQWVRGKSLDTFCPLGPWIVTADEIENPNDLYIRCWLNGTIMQESNTNMMIFNIPEIVRYLSKNFTLMPGDIVLTGTPQGTGAFRTPPLYMRDGDEVVVEIEKLGRLSNRCREL